MSRQSLHFLLMASEKYGPLCNSVALHKQSGTGHSAHPPSPSWARQTSYSLKSSNVDLQEKLWEYLLSTCKCRRQPVSTGEMVVSPAPPSPSSRRWTRESGQHSPEEAVKEKRDPDKNAAWINYNAQPDARERDPAKPREQRGSTVAEASWAAAQKACPRAL